MIRFPVASLALLATPALASDLIVTPGGSIQAAIDLAAPGDRILVQPGTYHEVIDLRGKLIEVRAPFGPMATTIDGTGLTRPVVTATSVEPFGTLLAGFRLKGGDGRLYTSGSQGAFLYGGGAFVGNGSSLRLENCVFDGNGYTGLGNTGSDYGGGLYVGRLGSYCELYRCAFVNNFAWIHGGAAMVDSEGTLRLEQCSLSNNSSGDQVTAPGGVSVAANAVLDVLGTASWNIFGPEIGYLPAPGNGSTVTVRYSDLQGGHPGVGNIDVDPAFVGPGAGNLQIPMTSPCIDASDPASPVDADGTRADMGAYPYLTTAAMVALCAGDGSGASCPCGNDAPAGSGAGCRNSTGSGAVLSASGVARLSGDTVTLQGSGTPPSTTGLFFQGTTSIASGSGVAFGDGLRCVGGTQRRLAVRVASGGISSFGYGNAGDVPVSFAGAVPPNGGVLYYQLWYRDASPYCTAFTFNLTNAVRVAWAP